jgi:hypothetical protein
LSNEFAPILRIATGATSLKLFCLALFTDVMEFGSGEFSGVTEISEACPPPTIMIMVGEDGDP